MTYRIHMENRTKEGLWRGLDIEADSPDEAKQIANDSLPLWEAKKAFKKRS